MGPAGTAAALGASWSFLSGFSDLRSARVAAADATSPASRAPSFNSPSESNVSSASVKDRAPRRSAPRASSGAEDWMATAIDWGTGSLSRWRIGWRAPFSVRMKSPTDSPSTKRPPASRTTAGTMASGATESPARSAAREMNDTLARRPPAVRAVTTMVWRLMSAPKSISVAYGALRSVDTSLPSTKKSIPATESPGGSVGSMTIRVTPTR